MKKLIAWMLVLVLTLSGCGGEAPETTAPTTEPAITQAPATVPTEPVTEPTTEPTTVPTEAPPVDVNPLTGQELEEVNTNRPIAVMVNNQKEALPQCGIGSADIIYEILAEGSTTRLMAVFTAPENAGPIGPVRSLRAYFLNIMRGYDAISTSAGGSSEADNMVYSLGYDRMNGIAGNSAGYFYRDDWRRENRGYEHSMFITGEKLLRGSSECGFRTTEQENADYGLAFTDELLTDGTEVSQIDVRFRSDGKTTSLIYDAEQGIFTAYQQKQDLIDGTTGEKIPFRNVVVLYAHTYVMDAEAHLSVQTTGEGKGYYARDGRGVEITWSRETETAPYHYFDLDGNPIDFGVGKSYIAILPEGSPVNFVAPSGN